MSVTIDLPPELEQSLRERNDDLERVAREALIIQLYRDAAISTGMVGELLGIGTLAAQDWLAARGVGPNYDFDDFLDDLDTLDEVFGRKKQDPKCAG